MEKFLLQIYYYISRQLLRLKVISHLFWTETVFTFIHWVNTFYMTGTPQIGFLPQKDG